MLPPQATHPAKSPEHRVPQPCRSGRLPMVVCKLGKPLESSPAQPKSMEQSKLRENRRLPIFNASDPRSLIAKAKP